MQWLEPWQAAEQINEKVAQGLLHQLQTELPPGHALFGIPVKLLARGNGDDVLFELLDGSGRVASVHLTWSKSRERLPWPGTEIHPSLQDWADQVMLPEHQEWSS